MCVYVSKEYAQARVTVAAYCHTLYLHHETIAYNGESSSKHPTTLYLCTVNTSCNCEQIQIFCSHPHHSLHPLSLSSYNMFSETMLLLLKTHRKQLHFHLQLRKLYRLRVVEINIQLHACTFILFEF